MEEFIGLCSQNSLSTGPELEQRVRSLLKTGRLNLLQRHGNGGWYPLHYAVKFGRGDIVRLFITVSGCDPHLQTRDSQSTALHIACEHVQTKIVEVLCQLIPDGTPARTDRNGNTPLHVACSKGSLEIVKSLTSKYSGRGRNIRETNRDRSTPLGIAVKEGHHSIAQFLMSQNEAVGNPATTFPDFRDLFPNFRRKQSLNNPVSIFVMGDRKTGKSTLIKSIQTEGYINRTIGVFLPTPNVDYHSGGIVASDASTYRYGRAKFYELASCRQTTHENVFSTFAKTGKAIFVIVVSFKPEMKEMESTLLYWLSFIHNQWKNASTQPYVVVVGSFLFYRPLMTIRLDNHHRLRVVYHRVLGTYHELCSNFHFVGKFSMDCRRSTSPGMDQLRRVLHHKCRELRVTGGEENVPSSCYVLWSALHALRPDRSDPPVVRLSEIEQMVSTEQASSSRVSLFSLLPNRNQNPHSVDINSLLVKLEERNAVHIMSHLNSNDPWIIFDDFKLITIVDSALDPSQQPVSEERNDNPAIKSDDELVLSLSTLSNSLKKDLLLNILHYFMITEVMARGNDTKYFLPSVLNSISDDEIMPTWERNDPNYTIGFAQCIIPQSNQVIPFFMPRFLYFLLYELNYCVGDCEKIVMSHSSLYFKITELLQVYVTVNSSAIIINMRCTDSGVFSCLRFRNQFESIIRQQRARFQSEVLVSEYVASMHRVSLPVSVNNVKHIQKSGMTVSDLKSCLVDQSSPTTDLDASKLKSFEPYEWLSKLPKQHRENLVNHKLTNVQVSNLFIRELARCVGHNWKRLVEVSGDLQNCDTSSPSDDNSSGQESSDQSQDPPQRPTYHTLLQVFSSMSIFHADLATALTNPELFSVAGPQNDNVGDSGLTEEQQQQLEEEEEQQDVNDSASDLPRSSSSSTSQAVLHTSGPDLSHHSQTDVVTLKTCSTGSDVSSVASVISNVPCMKLSPAPLSTSHTQPNIQFVGRPQVLRCSSSGGTFTDPIHGVSFTIPHQAVKHGSEIELEYAIAAVGPFTYPNQLTPVSCIIWVRAKATEKLRRPLRIEIPHTVRIDSQQHTRLLQVLCAQEQGDTYAFVRAHKASRIYSNRGTLSTKLSKPQYLFCIAATKCKEITCRTQYYLVQVTPNKRLSYSWKLYFFVTFALPACVELVRQQFDGDHTVEEKGFHFNTSGESTDPSITLDHTKITPERWTISKEGSYRQIEASKVELGNKSSFEMSYHMYPPNFAIAVKGNQATGDSCVELCFRGTTQSELIYDIILTLPRRYNLISTSTMDEEAEMDPKLLNPSQISEEDRVVRHFSLSGRNPSPSPTRSIRSDTILYTRTLRGSAEQASPPRNPFVDHMDVEKKHAMEVLTNNYDNICRQLSNPIIRRTLVQQKALTIDQAQVLINTANTSESDANERLIHMIEKGGVNGFKQFMIALEKTSSDHRGHQDLFERLVSQLNHLRPHSQSAIEILSYVT